MVSRQAASQERLQIVTGRRQDLTRVQGAHISPQRNLRFVVLLVRAAVAASGRDSKAACPGSGLHACPIRSIVSRTAANGACYRFGSHDVIPEQLGSPAAMRVE